MVCYPSYTGGLLAGKFGIGSEPLEGRFQIDSAQGIKYRQRFWNKRYFEAIDLFKTACEKHGLSTTEAAHRWLVHHSALSKSYGDGIRIFNL